MLICAMGDSFSSSQFSISREKVGCRKKLTLIPQLLAREVCRLRWQGGCTHQLLSCPSTPGADILPAASDLLIALFLVSQQSSCLYTLIHKSCGSCPAQGLIRNSPFCSFLIISQLILLFTFLVQVLLTINLKFLSFLMLFSTTDLKLCNGECGL